MGGVRWTPEEYHRYLKEHPHAAGTLDEKPIRKAIVESMNLGEAVSAFSEAVEPYAKILAMEEDEEPEIEFKSKTEKRAWEQWIPTVDPVAAYYEAIRVRLNSGKYTPDFLLRMPNRELWLIEVKGSWNAYQSGRSSKKSLLEAAKLYWWLGRWFSLLPKKGGGWNLEEIK